MPERTLPASRLSALGRPAVTLLLPTLLLLLGARPAPEAPTLPVPVTLFSFDSADEADWEVVNDGVMGGRSSGFVSVQDGILQFTGTLVTQDGGFTSVRARRVIDLTGYTGLELRVRGSGRQFEVEVNDGLRIYRRDVSRRAAFPTSGEWTLVRIPFSTLQSTAHGEPVSVPPVNLAGVQGVGLYIADGQDGAFRLEVDFVRVYGVK